MADYNPQKFRIKHGGSDEWYTPEWAVEAIADYLPVGGGRILCPFDTRESAFFRILTRRGYDVTCSHINEGVDFFERDLTGFDYVISNPPFSRRNDVLSRLYDAGVAFAMLQNVSGLFDSKSRMILADRGCGIIYIYPRVEFKNADLKEGVRVPFQSCYWTRGILPDGSVRFWRK